MVGVALRSVHQPRCVDPLQKIPDQGPSSMRCSVLGACPHPDALGWPLAVLGRRRFRPEPACPGRDCASFPGAECRLSMLSST